MKRTLFFFSAFLLLSLVIVGFNAWRSGTLKVSDLRALATRSDILIEENVMRDGTVLCLPQKTARANMQDCIYGFKTFEGELYELLDIERAGPEGTIQRGDTLRIMGDVVVSRKEKEIDVVGAIRIERVQDI
ncbi:MAG: hypothetical protein WDZ74_01795 [Candidatus Paceibacterota bacterium]